VKIVFVPGSSITFLLKYWEKDRAAKYLLSIKGKTKNEKRKTKNEKRKTKNDENDENLIAIMRKVSLLDGVHDYEVLVKWKFIRYCNYWRYKYTSEVDNI
jgi:hypothetical protein